MPLPPQSDHKIPLDQAATMTKRHRDALGARSKDEGQKGGVFFRAPVQELLAQPGCEGLRIYYARTDKGVPSLVLVAVDKDGNDMAAAGVLEWIAPCPPYCGDPNALNG